MGHRNQEKPIDARGFRHIFKGFQLGGIRFNKRVKFVKEIHNAVKFVRSQNGLHPPAEHGNIKIQIDVVLMQHGFNFAQQQGSNRILFQRCGQLIDGCNTFVQVCQLVLNGIPGLKEVFSFASHAVNQCFQIGHRRNNHATLIQCGYYPLFQPNQKTAVCADPGRVKVVYHQRTLRPTSEEQFFQILSI